MRKASMDVVNWLNCIWLTDLPSNSKYLACYLRKFMNSNNDIAWPSYARIVSETGLSKSTVAKYLKILEQEGWIERHSGNSNTNTVYIASLPKQIGETVKEFDNKIQDQLKGSASHGLRSARDELHVVRETDTNIQVNKQSNKQSNTGIFSGKQKETYPIERVSERFPLCNEAINTLLCLKVREFNSYTGELSLDEWEDCELAMRSVDEFDFEFFIWWMETRSKSMRKTPSLPNILSDKNGIPFDQFYDSTFMQEWD